MTVAVRRARPLSQQGCHGEFGVWHHRQLSLLMPENGVIFSNGIETDFLAFNSGVQVVIERAEKQGRLVV